MPVEMPLAQPFAGVASDKASVGELTSSGTDAKEGNDLLNRDRVQQLKTSTFGACSVASIPHICEFDDSSKGVDSFASHEWKEFLKELELTSTQKQCPPTPRCPRSRRRTRPRPSPSPTGTTAGNSIARQNGDSQYPVLKQEGYGNDSVDQRKGLRKEMDLRLDKIFREK